LVAIRITDGELHGRPSAGRDANNDHLDDAKTVEELGIGIGLHRRRKVAGQSRAKIAKRGRSDELLSAPGQYAGQIDALIKPAAGAVDNQHRLALTYHGVFQRAERSLNRLAAADEAGACGRHVTRSDCVDAGGGNNEDCENDKKDSADESLYPCLPRWTHQYEYRDVAFS
jgi:hypothetical protein